MLCIVLLSIFISGIIANPAGTHTRRTRNINGGQPDSISNHPYVVALVVEGELWCSGSILTKYQILTSGNCITDKTTKDMRVHAGSSFWARPKSRHYIKDYMVYGRETYTNVAIMKISPPFVFDQTRQPVRLSPMSYILRAGKVGVVTGWMVKRHTVTTTQLLTAKAAIMDTSVCSEAYAGTPVGQITGGQFCAGLNGKESCECDAGNPIVVDGYQVGISYEGFKCGVYDYPTIYTDITHYHRWIRKQMLHKLEDYETEDERLEQQGETSGNKLMELD